MSNIYDSSNTGTEETVFIKKELYSLLQKFFNSRNIYNKDIIDSNFDFIAKHVEDKSKEYIETTTMDIINTPDRVQEVGHIVSLYNNTEVKIRQITEICREYFNNKGIDFKTMTTKKLQEQYFPQRIIDIFCEKLPKACLFDIINRTFETMRDERTLAHNVTTKFCSYVSKSGGLSQFKTKRGKTQKSERKYQTYVRAALDTLYIEYDQAGSQQPGDFRINKHYGQDISMILECKKTDGRKVKFNDTYPKKDWYYLIISTKKDCVYLVPGYKFWLGQSHNGPKNYKAEIRQYGKKYQTPLMSNCARSNWDCIDITQSYFDDCKYPIYTS